jgi:hypothetical protein
MENRPGPFRRLGIFLPSLVVLAVMVGWCGYWVFARHLAQDQLAAWLERERALGRTWTCPDQSFGGFPFRLVLTCRQPNFAGTLNGRPVEGSLSELRAVAQLYQPTRLIAEIDGPLELNGQSDGRNLVLSWDLLRASLVGTPHALDRLAATADKLQIAALAGTPAELKAAAEHAELHVRRAASRPAEDKAFDIAASVSAATNATLDALLGSTAPANGEIVGVLSHGDFSGEGTGPQKLERWRIAGGSFDIERASLAKGAARLSFSGHLGLDEERRLRGQIEADFEGLEPVLVQFGLPAAALNVGTVLQNILSGKPAVKGETKPLHLRITFDKGRALIGSLPIPIALSPLY